MTKRTETTKQSYEFVKPLVMYGAGGQPRQLLDVHAELVLREARPHGLTITFQLAPLVYEQVEAAEEFNLAAAMREELDGPPFDNRAQVVVEARLHPQYYEYLAAFTDDLSRIEPYLRGLSAQEPEHPLVDASSWFATEVSQKSPRGTTRFRTFWHRLRISGDTMDRLQHGDFNDAIQEFIRSKIGVDMQQLPQELIDDDVRNFADQISQVATETVRALFLGDAEDGTGTDDEETLAAAADNNLPLQRVAEFLENDGWSWQMEEEGFALLTGVTSEQGAFMCRIVWEVTNRYLVCYAVAPAPAPPERRVAMMEFLARANYGLPSGAFEIDLEDGEVRFRNTLFVDRAYPSDKQISELLYTAVYTANDYFPGVGQVNQGASPRAALAAIEGA